LTIEADGLIVDRKVMSAKYLWAAFQGVEIAKNAVILPVDNGIGELSFRYPHSRLMPSAMILRLSFQSIWKKAYAPHCNGY
jgi:hypothetical protein